MCNRRMLCVALLLSTAQTRLAASVHAVPEDHAVRLVHFRSQQDRSPTVAGTGIFLRFEGKTYIVTAYHVIREKQDLQIEGETGRRVDVQQLTDGKAILEPAADLCVLCCTPDGAEKLKSKPFLRKAIAIPNHRGGRDQVPKAGRKVLAIGNVDFRGKADFNRAAQGTIEITGEAGRLLGLATVLDQAREAPILVVRAANTDNPIEGGFSGGPVFVSPVEDFSKQYHLAGMVIGGDKERAVGWSLSADKVYEILTRAEWSRFPPKKWPKPLFMDHVSRLRIPYQAISARVVSELSRNRMDRALAWLTIPAQYFDYSNDVLENFKNRLNSTLALYAKPRLERLFEHSAVAASVDVSPDGMKVAAVFRDGALRVWDLNSGQRVGESIRGHGILYGTHPTAKFHPTKPLLLSVTSDGRIRFWKITSDNAICRARDPVIFHGGFQSTQFSPDCRYLLVEPWSGDEKGFQLVQLETGAVLTIPSEETWDAITFSPDGKYLAAAGKQRAYLWDLDQGFKEPLISVRLEKLREASSYVAFSSDSRFVILPDDPTGPYDDSAQVWQITSKDRSGKALRPLDFVIEGVAFNPQNHEQIATWHESDNIVRLWHWSPGGTYSAVEGELPHHRQLESVRFTADGASVLTLRQPAGNDLP